MYEAPFPVPAASDRYRLKGELARWRRDGKEIFYVTLDGQPMAAEVAARNGTLEVGRVQKLFDGIVINPASPSPELEKVSFRRRRYSGLGRTLIG